ncbi:MAG: ribosomal-protein-alanine acetyltransferase [Actinomycetota bacterium]
MIRPMKLADLDAVMEIELDLFPKEAWSKDMFLEELAEVPQSREVVVLEQSDQIIGYASLRFVGREGDINTIAIARGHQRQGLGKKLLNWLEETAVSHGVRELFLDVRTDNEPAIDLYKGAGFVRIDIRRNYYGPSIDADVMRKKLA